MSKSIVDQSFFGPTPLTPRLGPLNHNNKWHSWRGLHIPDQYEGLSVELKALYKHATIEDKSPMNYYSITGKDSGAFIDYLVTRDMSTVPVGAGKYTPWLDEDGKVVIDTPVFHVGDSHWVTMGGVLTGWLSQHSSKFEVEIEDWSDIKMVVPLQGPASRKIVESATGEDWSDIKFMHGRQTKIAGKDVWIWRAGYNPQMGFEFHFNRDDALEVWDAIMAIGKELGLVPIGQNAVQVARTEASLIVPGIDYTRAGTDPQIAAYALLDDGGNVSPGEIGLDRFVNTNKSAPFIGKEAFLEEQANGGVTRTLVGIEVNWHDIASLFEKAGQAPEITRRIDYRRHKVLINGNVAGKATSLCWSPTLRKEIALCQIDKEHSEVGTELTMEWREHGSSAEKIDDVIHGTVRATIVETPFISKDSKFG